MQIMYKPTLFDLTVSAFFPALSHLPVNVGYGSHQVESSIANCGLGEQVHGLHTLPVVVPSVPVKSKIFVKMITRGDESER
jgi:hypothetical protein